MSNVSRGSSLDCGVCKLHRVETRGAMDSVLMARTSLVPPANLKTMEECP